MARIQYALPGEDEVRQVAGTMRATVAMLDGTAELLERLALMAADDVADDFQRHAEAIRAIRRQVAGAPGECRSPGGYGGLPFHPEADAAD